MAHPKHDFMAETRGDCFLCSNKITTEDLNSESESCPSYSLDCLSRYLKIDMKKVFTGSGPIPPHLVARVELSRLKTELCEKCILLNRKFSKLYQQWEKTEMEMASCLNLLQKNLERAVKPENKAEYWNDMNRNSMAKQEIIKALRMDTLQKCSRRLSAARPLTKLQKLTRKQINKEKRKLKPRKVVAGIYQEPSPYPEANYDGGDDNFGSPSSPYNENGNANIDEESASSPSAMVEIYEAKPLPIKQEVVEGSPVSYEMEGRQNQTGRDGLQPTCQTTTNLKRKVNNNTGTNQLSQIIPPPIIVGSGVGIVEKLNISINPETGKYKCPNCSKEYSLHSVCRIHHKSTHSNVKYKCATCQIDFNFKHENHYLSIHLGVRFQCGKCDKTFTQKGQMMQHQKKAHLE